MARPNRIEALMKQKRDNQIVLMKERGFPLDYIAATYNISRGRVVQILQRKQRERLRSKARKKKKLNDEEKTTK